jgi:hypothetical protein
MVGLMRNRTQPKRAGRLVAIVATIAILVMAVRSLGFCAAFPPSASAAAHQATSTFTMKGLGQHAGAFQLFNRAEVHGLLDSGMNLVLDPPELIQKLERDAPHAAVVYIDNLTGLIYDNIQGLEPLSSATSCFYHGCVITSSEITGIHTEISAELQRAKRDPRIVGFYIQDDPIGDTRLLNQDIHTWVNQAGLRQPTICGFKGRLDAPSSRWWMSKLPYFAADVEGSYEKLSNYSPQGCDVVALYPYDGQASNKQTAERLAKKTDWNMDKAVWPCGSEKCTLLKFYKHELRKLGWTPATPLIGVPQAFGFDFSDASGQGFVWPAPTTRQLAEETAAFCAQGAVAIVAWAWDTPASNSSTPYMDRPLRDGLAKGASTCRAIWRHHGAPLSR